MRTSSTPINNLNLQKHAVEKTSQLEQTDHRQVSNSKKKTKKQKREKNQTNRIIEGKRVGSSR